jgi:hypothetical protein
VDEEVLAFTRAEAAELFQKEGLTPEQARIAFEHTHGRAAALANLAVALRLPEANERDGFVVFDLPPSVEAT